MRRRSIAEKIEDETEAGAPEAEEATAALVVNSTLPFKFELNPNVQKESSANAYLQFWNKKQSKTPDVKAAVGEGVQVGHPYLVHEGTVYDVAGCVFTILLHFPYWARFKEFRESDTGPPEVTHCWTTPQEWGAAKECMLSVVALTGGKRDLHEDLGPVVVASCDFNGAKAPAAKSHLHAMGKSLSPSWAKEYGPLATLPPFYRVWGEFRPKATTAKSGFSYAKIGARSRPAGPKQLLALKAWWDSGDEDDVIAFDRTFHLKVADLEEVAKTTAEIEPVALKANNKKTN